MNPISALAQMVRNHELMLEEIAPAPLLVLMPFVLTGAIVGNGGAHLISYLCLVVLLACNVAYFTAATMMVRKRRRQHAAFLISQTSLFSHS